MKILALGCLHRKVPKKLLKLQNQKFDAVLYAGDYSDGDKLRFHGENNTLFLQLRKGGLSIKNSRGYKEVKTYGFIEEDEEDIIGKVYSIVPTFD